jgi:predicted flap endonuclease-1-like 5' DNA nuclease
VVGVLFKRKPADGGDDLTEIVGVADVLNKRLHKFGVYYFKQIALWSKSSIEAFQEKIGFKDRIQREKWIQQCRKLHKAKYRESV